MTGAATAIKSPGSRRPRFCAPAQPGTRITSIAVGTCRSVSQLFLGRRSGQPSPPPRPWETAAHGYL
jgi:hypothetical protein